MLIFFTGTPGHLDLDNHTFVADPSPFWQPPRPLQPPQPALAAASGSEGQVLGGAASVAIDGVRGTVWVLHR